MRSLRASCGCGWRAASREPVAVERTLGHNVDTTTQRFIRPVLTPFLLAEAVVAEAAEAAAEAAAEEEELLLGCI